MPESWRIVLKKAEGCFAMNNSLERIFLYIAMVVLILSFPWLAFFPIIAYLAQEDNKQE